MNTATCTDHSEEQQRFADRHCPVCAVENLASTRRMLKDALWDIDAYRGALGYPVPGYHTGKLKDGTTPQCGSCNSEHRKSLEERAEKAESQVVYEQERNSNNVAMYSDQLKKAEAKCAELREAQIKFPDNLSALTVGLVLSFAQAMADKLSAAQIKHGYGDGWAETTHEWPIPECHEALMSHLKKGDPVDVANFCAFLWYHKIGTTDCGKGWHSPEEWDQLQAKCAEMREALQKLVVMYEDEYSDVAQHWRPEWLTSALSSDCGKDRFHAHELEPTKELLRRIISHYYEPLCEAKAAEDELKRLQKLTKETP